MTDINLTPMERIALDAVSEIQDIKRNEGGYPDYAALDEIINSLRAEMLEALRRLYRKGLVTHHLNVNGTSLFGVKSDGC